MFTGLGLSNMAVTFMFNPKANATPVTREISVFKRDCLKATSVNAHESHDQQNNLIFDTLIANYANNMVTNIYNFLRSYKT